jgi:hypothetical protein
MLEHECVVNIIYDLFMDCTFLSYYAQKGTGMLWSFNYCHLLLPKKYL